jgi:hypothetical protein
MSACEYVIEGSYAPAVRFGKDVDCTGKLCASVRCPA